MNQLEQLHLEWTNCKKCQLCSQSRQVFSDGSINARIIVIGEGPGRVESELGKPFVGPAGEYLTTELVKNNIQRNEVFFTNAVRAWPRFNGKTRIPNQSELDSCRLLLLKEIEIIKPRFILILGAVAAKSLLNHRASLGSIVGNWIKFNNIPALVTYHPASILHCSAKDRERYVIYKAQFERDIADLADKYRSDVATIISERNIIVNNQQEVF